MPFASRRRALALLGSGLLAACAPLPRASPFSLARARPYESRILEILVGLRPYRPAGYVVRMEPLGAKRVIHNYGHGGAGITLSWGSSMQAVELGFSGTGAPYAVMGCGVMGLTTATLLQRAGARVTVYAEHMPPHTTSNIAGGHWSPYSVFEARAVGDAFRRQFQDAVRRSFHAFESLAGTRGVSWRRNFAVHDRRTPFPDRVEALRGLLPEMAMLEPGHHPFGNSHVQTFTSLMIEPPIYLESLRADFVASGGRLEVRTFATREDVAALPEPVIFNCTGLGSRALFDDLDLVAARGQLVKLIPQPEVDYNLFSDNMYMFPRRDGIVLGGSFDVGDWSLAPDPATTQRILARAARAMARLG